MINVHDIKKKIKYALHMEHSSVKKKNRTIELTLLDLRQL